MPTIRMTRALALAAVTTIAALAIAVPGAFAAGTNVTIADFTYQPATVTITVGDSVTWKNTDEAPHTATAESGGTFDSGILAQGETFTETFQAAGTIAYFCSVHPDMKGKVVVRAAGGSTPGASTVPDGTPVPDTSPGASPPPTDTLDDAQGGGGTPVQMLIVLAAAAFLGTFVARRRLASLDETRW